jgi:hypothetical protein
VISWNRRLVVVVISSFTKNFESPIFKAACMIIPPGPGIRFNSVAPKAFL